MNRNEFIKMSVECGYSDKKHAENYVETYPKKVYSEDDFINLYHYNDPWNKNKSTKGLRKIYGVNGKTTAFSNGIKGNSSSGQDWSY